MQGQSYVTEAKQRGFVSAFNINMSVVKSKCLHWPGFRYFHFDLNAGGGMNDQVNCIGSPLAFLERARDYQVPYAAHFVDIAEPQIESLLARPEIADDPNAFVHHGDNTEFCDAIPDILALHNAKPRSTIGSIVVDANGADVPIDSLVGLLAQWPCLDLFWNVTATGLKRAGIDRPRLNQLLARIPRKHFLIRRPIGAFQWVMIFARNIPIGEHRAEGIYRLESDEGRAILDRASSTAAEMIERNQPRLL